MLICIDGVDFSGKDTAAANLKKLLIKQNRRVIISAFHHPETLLEQFPKKLRDDPEIVTYTKYARLIIQTIKKLDNIVYSDPDVVQMLYGSIIPMYVKVIELCKKHSIDVILPRSWTSGYAYHKGKSNGENTEKIMSYIKHLWPQIDLFVFLDTQKETIIKRKQNRQKTDKETILKAYENHIDYLLVVNENFKEIAKKVEGLIINAEENQHEIANKILQRLKEIKAIEN